MAPAHDFHFHVHGHLVGLSPELLAVALVAGITALLVGLVGPFGLPRGELEWPFVRQAGPAGGTAEPLSIHGQDEAMFAFAVGGYRGPDIFSAGMPASVEVDCVTGTPVDGSRRTPARGRLFYDAPARSYRYRWVMESAWSGTCRRLVLGLDDLSEHVLVVRVEDPADWIRNGRCGIVPVEPAAYLPAALTSLEAPEQASGSATDRWRSC